MRTCIRATRFLGPAWGRACILSSVLVPGLIPAFVAAPAAAQTKFDVVVGGDVFFEAGIVDQARDTDTRSVEFRNRFRVVVTPQAKADNGLSYGARLRFMALRADGAVSDDYAYIFASGSFGEVRAGQTVSYNSEVYITPPLDYRMLAIQDPAAAFLGAAPGAPSAQRATTVNGRTVVQGADVASLYGGAVSSLSTPKLDETGAATRLMYISPSFGGLTLAASYTPRGDSYGTEVNRVKTGATAPAVQTNWQDVVEVGATYRGKFNDVTVNLGTALHAGRSAKNPQASASDYQDLRAWQLGGQIGYGPVLAGFTYIDYGRSGLTKAPYLTAAGAPSAAATAFPVQSGGTRIWSVGAQYTLDRWLFGAGYSHGKDPGSLAIAGDRSLDMVTLGTAYTVAPGFRVGAEYVRFRSESDQSRGVPVSYDDRGNVLLLRSQLVF